MLAFQTERLQLRSAAANDVEAFHQILTDPRAMEFWSTLPHTDIQESRAWVAAMMEIQPEEGEDFVIEHKGKVIGKAGFFQFPEIGFILHPDAWGNGYAQEALGFVLDRAFSVHRLPRVVADVDPRNHASLRLLINLGFRETGRASRTWKIGGEWYDSVYLQLDNGCADEC